MVKWMRKEKAKASPHYRLLVDDAVERLQRIGYFCKDDVLESTQLTVFGDSIRWDYVREFINEMHKIELIPLAAVFFKFRHRDGDDDSRHGPEHPPAQFPERYIAQGYGKKTAGFCIADPRNGHFVIKRLEQQRKKVEGSTRKANEMLDHAKRIGVVGLENKRDLPLLSCPK